MAQLHRLCTSTPLAPFSTVTYPNICHLVYLSSQAQPLTHPLALPQGPTGFYNGSPERLAALALVTQSVLRAEGSTTLLLNPPMAGVAAGAVAFLNA